MMCGQCLYYYDNNWEHEYDHYLITLLYYNEVTNDIIDSYK